MARELTYRRLAAAALALLALVAATADRDDGVATLVLARDVPAGITLTDADVTARRIPARLVPAGAVTAADAATGRRLTAAGQDGEILTDGRILAPRGDADRRIVPLAPAERAVAGTLRPGDVVDVVTVGPAPASDAGEPADPAWTRAGQRGHDSGAPGPRLVASGAVVVLVDDAPAPGTSDRLVLVALPAADAAQLAAAGLTSDLTVVLH